MKRFAYLKPEYNLEASFSNQDFLVTLVAIQTKNVRKCSNQYFIRYVDQYF